MAEPFLAELRVFAFNFVPRGWAQCAGQILPISQNTALFALLGTTYGGNGTTNFALPDLRGRVAVHAGSGSGLTPYVQGQVGGSELHTLTTGEMPSHTHTLAAGAANGTTGDATQGVYAVPNINPRMQTLYSASSNTNLNASAVTNAGGGLGHENRQPSLALVYGIALVGIFPSRN